MAAPAKPGTSGNKPGEPPFQMKLEPEGKIYFKYKIGTPASLEVKITNTTSERQTFKVKCTDNDIFRVKPPLAFVEQGETFTVNVTFNAKKPAENNRHFLAIYHMKFDDKTKTARQAWSPGCGAEGVARILVAFEEEKEGEKKEEAKDEKEKESK